MSLHLYAFSAAYFYGSNGKQPGVNGYRIRDEKASWVENEL